MGCSVWTIRTSKHAELFRTMSSLFLNDMNSAGLITLDTTVADDDTMTVYFLNGTNQMVQETKTQDGMEMTLTHTEWDITTDISSDQFDVPTDWLPCPSTGPS